jgi:hypothetical protein
VWVALVIGLVGQCSCGLIGVIKQSLLERQWLGTIPQSNRNQQIPGSQTPVC